MTYDLKLTPEQKAEWERKQREGYDAFHKRRCKQRRETMERLTRGWANETITTEQALKAIGKNGDKLALFLEELIAHKRTLTHVTIFLSEYLNARKLLEDE